MEVNVSPAVFRCKKTWTKPNKTKQKKKKLHRNIIWFSNVLLPTSCLFSPSWLPLPGMTFSSLAASLNTRFFILRLKIPIEMEILLIEAQYLSSATWWQVIALETSSRAMEYPSSQVSKVRWNQRSSELLSNPSGKSLRWWVAEIMGVQHGPRSISGERICSHNESTRWWPGEKGRYCDIVIWADTETQPDSQGYLNCIDILRTLPVTLRVSPWKFFHCTLSVVLLKITLFWQGVGDSSVCKVFAEQIWRIEFSSPEQRHVLKSQCYGFLGLIGQLVYHTSTLHTSRRSCLKNQGGQRLRKIPDIDPYALYACTRTRTHFLLPSKISCIPLHGHLFYRWWKRSLRGWGQLRLHAGTDMADSQPTSSFSSNFRTPNGMMQLPSSQEVLHLQSLSSSQTFSKTFSWLMMIVHIHGVPQGNPLYVYKL